MSHFIRPIVISGIAMLWTFVLAIAGGGMADAEANLIEHGAPKILASIIGSLPDFLFSYWGALIAIALFLFSFVDFKFPEKLPYKLWRTVDIEEEDSTKLARIVADMEFIANRVPRYGSMSEISDSTTLVKEKISQLKNSTFNDIPTYRLQKLLWNYCQKAQITFSRTPISLQELQGLIKKQRKVEKHILWLSRRKR